MRIIFPLRTSVEWFRDPLSPAVEARIKQAAVLYDELLFEDGAFEADLTTDGAVQVWHPADTMSEERLAELKHPASHGVEVTLSFAKQPARGEPAPPEESMVFMRGKVLERYIAEYHYSVLGELAEFNTGWAQLAESGGVMPSDFGPDLGRAIRRARADKGLLGDKPHERAFIIDSFYRDLAVAQYCEAAISLSPLFAPMVERAAIEPNGDGASALTYLFPHVGDLPWEVVMEFRDHAAVREARQQLVQFEVTEAKHGRATADNAYTRAFVMAERDLRRKHSLTEKLARVLVSFLPGSALWSEGVGTLAERHHEAHSWTVALMKLSR